MGLNLKTKNNLKVVVSFSAIIFALMAKPIFADIEQRKYSIEELELMAKKKKWTSLVLFLRDIPTADHNLQWKNLVERSAMGYLSDLEKSGASETERVAQDLLREYPSLEASSKFISLQDDILIRGFERCYTNPADQSECGKRMIAMMKESQVSGNFRRRGAKLALSKSPELKTSLCEVLAQKNDLDESWRAQCAVK